MLVDDGYTVIKPNHIDVLQPGRWERMPAAAEVPGVVYSGNTDVNGEYTVIYPVAYSQVPCIKPQVITTSGLQSWRIVDSTVTGFTIKVEQIASLLGLLPEYNPVANHPARVFITEK
ncbi:hypothetical protein [Chitinophaga nivalis]|uniref:Uncharacterized protein n=1 Tax=Chitinophaga nivalis TaxID=2991709 RepID=A0ABT3IIM3_9BACT|nr:hypothetical protein [Chitinophaga nivalis]MCW3466491.1 hypothetical protein [Chitinophaga nivalis]MCW3483818.1 hypothetical protein [Chitinophaga nivalis]